jgi:membrane-bound lytic murein transglycosylase D
VKKGENLGSIAKQYGISVTELMQANDMKNDRIRQGKSLLIPIKVAPRKSSGKKPSKVRKYVVQLGDNLASIARQFGVSQEALRVWNSMDVASVVKQGDTIFVSKPDLRPANEDRKIVLNYQYVNGTETIHAHETLTFRNRMRDGVNEWQDENPAHYE